MDISEAACKIMRDKDEIVDLFCKTFLISQELKSMEELRALFEICELECTVGKDFSQTFRIKLKE